MENNGRLRRVWKIALCAAAAAGTVAGARTVEGSGRPQVLVCMERGSDPGFVIPPAQALTTWMFHQIGVALAWRDLRHCPEELRPIVIGMSLDTPREVFPKALAASYPFEGFHVRVFYDRVRTVTLGCPIPVLLAHVLAHEISHILQGTDQHSASGVMKSRWDINDYARMAREPLPFTDLDVRAIHRGLGARTERFPGAARDERVADGSPPLPPSFCEDSKRP